MFDFIRTHQRLMQLILLALILPSFALIGISGYTSYVSGDHDLVEIGSSSITRQAFDQAHREQLQRMQAGLGANFDPAVHDTEQVRQELLDGLIARQVLADELARNRLSVSDRALLRFIEQAPDFQENGVFSPAQYAAVLTSMGLSGKAFEQGQRAELALQRVLGPIASTVQVPDASVAALAQALVVERVVRVRPFRAADYEAGIQGAGATADDASTQAQMQTRIQAWYETNQERLRVPESVNVEYLVLDEATAMQGVADVSEADLQAYYEQNQARFVQPARSRVSHIQWLVPAGAGAPQVGEIRQQAQAVAAQAAAEPARFAALAQAHSQDAGTAGSGGLLGWITRGTWPAEIENAVFGLQAGQVSGVVEVSGNLHVFLVAESQPEQKQEFAEVRAQLEQEVKRQLASNRFADMATRLTDLVYEHSTDLSQATRALNLPLRRARGIAADRLLPADVLPVLTATAVADGGDTAETVPVAADSKDADLLNTPRLRRELFSASSLRERQNTGVIEISAGVMVAARVREVVPAHVRALDQARDFVRTQVIVEYGRQAAQTAGEAALAALQKSATVAVDDSQFSAPLRVSRLNAPGFDEAALNALFALDQVPGLMGFANDEGYTLVRLDAVEQAKDLLPMLQDSLRAQINQALALTEQRAVLALMREQARVKLLPEAQQALDPAQDDGA